MKVLGEKMLVVVDFEMTSGSLRDENAELLSVGLVAARLGGRKGSRSFRVAAARDMNVLPSVKSDEIDSHFWQQNSKAFQIATATPQLGRVNAMKSLASWVAELKAISRYGLLFAAWPARVETEWLRHYEELTGVETGIDGEITCLRGVFDEVANSSWCGLENLPAELNHPHVALIDALGEVVIGLSLYSFCERGEIVALDSKIEYRVHSEEERVRELFAKLRVDRPTSFALT